MYRRLITPTQLSADLQQLGITPAHPLLVHSSLRAIAGDGGWICGGAQAVVQALQNQLSPGGTVVMPSQSTYLTDPRKWVNPPVPPSWWATIRAEMPAYDQALTPTRNMGTIVETFRQQCNVLRSPHPTLSFVAWGNEATHLTARHPLDHGLGETSPLARLYNLDAHILLLGVGFNKNTSLHLAEHRAYWPAKQNERESSPVLTERGREWVSYTQLDYDNRDFALIGEALPTNIVKIGRLGFAQALLMPMRPVVDFAAQWMSQYRL